MLLRWSILLFALGCAASQPGADLPSPWVEDSEHMRFLVPVQSTPARGAERPLVTLVVFTDFECPFCRQLNPTLSRLLDEHADEVRLHLRHLPMPFHERAPLAAEAAEEARAQQGDDGFFRYQDRLLDNDGPLDLDALVGHAETLGFAVPRFRSALERRIHRGRVERDLDFSDRLNVEGTPTLFLNGRQVVGAIPYADLERVLSEELALARRALSSGVPRQHLYAVAQRDALEFIPRAPRGSRGDARRLDRRVIYQVPLDDAPIRGPRDATVTIVTFSDFQCPFCADVNETLAALVRAYPNQIRIAFRHHPISSHRDAHDAAAASLEAQAQGGDDAFWRMHDHLFAVGARALSHEELFRYAEEQSLDVERFRAAIVSGVHHRAIERDMALARRLGQRGTPMFYVNGRLVSGSQPIHVFREAVEDALVRAQAAVQRGASSDGLYEAVIANGASEAVWRGGD